ncbi:MAG: hypothetical protein ABFS34_11530 [Gemmatimonadota bacterium]
MNDDSHSRRRFIAALPAAAFAIAAAVRPRRALAAPGSGDRVRARCPTHGVRHAAVHPDPRPGVDASKVIPDEKVPGPLKEMFDLVREAPQIVDGVRCHCGCAEIPGYYSLLSCFEKPGMALGCEICQGQGKMVGRMARDGASLEEIREAVDDKFA